MNRILFEIEGRTIVINRVRLRKEAYREICEALSIESKVSLHTQLSGGPIFEDHLNRRSI